MDDTRELEGSGVMFFGDDPENIMSGRHLLNEFFGDNGMNHAVAFASLLLGFFFLWKALKRG